ncbi:3'-5' exonuclease [Vandammella animalimorsus]|uniref:3'-5' exonuclease n=1 Tax=Vandammella animalimorsus TaxID=2029117 RepID=UPI000BAA6C72|nr:3'-5' exonuclease [Vandammella animalimorsus]
MTPVSPPDDEDGQGPVSKGPVSLLGRAMAKLPRPDPLALLPAWLRRAQAPRRQYAGTALDSLASHSPSLLQDMPEASGPDAGHHIVHGVAGSGKTRMLRAHLAYLVQQYAARGIHGPILVLCYNEPLAVWLQYELMRQGLSPQQVVVRHFHRWCREQLIAYHLELPPRSMPASAQIKNIVERVLRALSDGSIPAGQYAAVLVDEAHDFPASWLGVLTQLPTPATNHLVLYFDDAQSILKRKRTGLVQLHQHGIDTRQVQHLTLNQRNPEPIFNAALHMAGTLAAPIEVGPQGIPRLKPRSSGRSGDSVLLFPAPSLRAQGRKVAELLLQARREAGIAWGQMAVLCDNRFQLDVCHGALRYQHIPHQMRRGTGEFDPAADTVKLMSLQACAGLEFELVVIVDSAEVPANQEGMEDRQRRLYIAATRAKRKLYVVSLQTASA